MGKKPKRWTSGGNFEGDEEKINRIIEWAHGGPANARVEDVEIQNEKFIGEFSKFDVLY